MAEWAPSYAQMGSEHWAVGFDFIEYHECVGKLGLDIKNKRNFVIETEC